MFSGATVTTNRCFPNDPHINEYPLSVRPVVYRRVQHIATGVDTVGTDAPTVTAARHVCSPLGAKLSTALHGATVSTRSGPAQF